MPDVIWQDENFDCFILCVDRLSGWMIARPAQATGPTGEKAALLIVDGGWGELGIPSQMTSDQGQNSSANFGSLYAHGWV